jgi:hypothetical protein
VGEGGWGEADLLRHNCTTSPGRTEQIRRDEAHEAQPADLDRQADALHCHPVEADPAQIVE